MATTVAVVVALFAAALAAAATSHGALVEHTFVVSQVKLHRLCNDTLVTVVNGQLPGPAIEVHEGDSLAVHVINKSPYGVTIHWHGVKMQHNCWADGAGMITQCPIHPNSNFTYRFNVANHEGTLWWHAHVGNIRATVHGILIIRPRSRPSSYPFPTPDKEIPIVIGEWWDMDLYELERKYRKGLILSTARAATINGRLGDLQHCSGVIEDKIRVTVEHGKTYLLRIVNAALGTDFYLKIAGHRFTVVAADANYVKPYSTDTIAIAPGETVDALLVADAPHGEYYMVAMSYQPPAPAIQVPLYISRAIVQYKDSSSSKQRGENNAPIMAPEMPDEHDALTSFNFYGNLRSTPRPPSRPAVPAHVDEHLFYALDSGFLCGGDGVCEDIGIAPRMAMINNVSFELPVATPLLQAHYRGNLSRGSIGTLRELPDRAPRMFRYNNTAEPTSRATSVRRLRHNAAVEIVFHSPVLPDSYSNPMHLHGHDLFVVAQGLGRYDEEKDVEKYNLVDPPVRNTVSVPMFGWSAVRFVANNPGVWFLHCHLGHHSSSGMAVAIVVEDGPTPDTSLPPPPGPADLASCQSYDSRLADE